MHLLIHFPSARAEPIQSHELEIPSGHPVCLAEPEELKPSFAAFHVFWEEAGSENVGTLAQTL